VNLGLLALLAAAGLAGPIGAWSQRARIPVVVGEILAGVVLGRTGFGVIHSSQTVVSFLAQAGFALVMLTAGSHVPLHDPELRRAAPRGLLLAAAVGAAALPVGFGVAVVAGTTHGLLYAVVMASSSAALVLPVMDEAGLTGERTLLLLGQVAVADTACIVMLPLAEQPSRAAHAAAGAGWVMLAAVGFGALIYCGRRRGWFDKLRQRSVASNFGLELRINLIVVFSLAGLAEHVGVSVMLAGFAAGLLLAAQGEPRRLAAQLFAVSDGFLAPLFFVWLGASLDLSALGRHPKFVLVGTCLGAGAIVVHAVVGRLARQSWALGSLAAAELGLPISAVTIGEKAHVLAPGEGGALLIGMLMTLVAVAVAAGLSTRAQPGDQRPPTAASGSATASPAPSGGGPGSPPTKR
jgi:Kef-type K+ transport system membrane component KefB